MEESPSISENRAWRIALILLLALFPGAAYGDSPGANVGDGGAGPRILFIGNSYSFYNDLPDLLASLAAANQIPAQVRIVARNGASLEDHWRDGDALHLLQAQRWDFVVLQERGSIVRTRTERSESFAGLFDREIKKAGARTLLYVTPAGKGNDAESEALDRGYLRIARSLGATLVPVGSAFRRAYEESPEAALHAPDGIHPGPQGTWLAAYVFYMTLFDELPERTSCEEGWTCPPDETDRLFRRSAAAAIRASVARDEP